MNIEGTLTPPQNRSPSVFLLLVSPFLDAGGFGGNLKRWFEKTGNAERWLLGC